ASDPPRPRECGGYRPVEYRSGVGSQSLGRDMAGEHPFVMVLRRRFPFGRHMQAEKFLPNLFERAHRPCIAPRLDRVRSIFDGPEQLLGLAAGFVGRDRAILADGHAARAPVLAKLHHEHPLAGNLLARGFLAVWESSDAEALQSAPSQW